MNFQVLRVTIFNMIKLIKISGFALGVIISFSFVSSVNAVLCLPVSSVYCQEKLEESVLEQEKQAELNKIFQERLSILASYKQFFNEVGVNLSVTTSESEYQKWLNDLIELKADYDSEKQKQKELAEKEAADKILEEAESRAKMKDLEERIKILESQKPVTPTVPVKKIYQSAETNISPVMQAEPDPIIENDYEVELFTVVESVTQSTLRVHWFKRFINWFTRK